MPQKSLENLLNPNADGELGDIVRRARELGALTEALQRDLPAETADGILSASIRDAGELVVLAASPAWAAKLRFESDRMLVIARKTGADVHCCKVRVSRDANTA